MSMIAMAQPTAHPNFKRELMWDDSRPLEHCSQPRVDGERVALPSIRQMIPDLQFRFTGPESSVRSPSSTSSPTLVYPATRTSPEYALSPNPNKRRRGSFDEEQDERPRQIPRLYASPQRELGPRPDVSPTFGARSAPEAWNTSFRTSPRLPSIRSAATLEVPERSEPRHALPTLPALSIPPMRSRSRDEYVSQAPRSLATLHNSPMTVGYHHTYHHPARSLGSMQYDHSPFSPAGYGAHYPDYVQLGGMGMGSDSKQRKRRGNLPKETTDKLRAWFVAHLTHPYPTEDEKQELMRQTGLQMNQISNWFINARRRQLPIMINTIRTESDPASSSRTVDGKVLPSTERSTDEQTKRRDGGSLSDRGNSPSEDEFEAGKRRDAASLQRGSV